MMMHDDDPDAEMNLTSTARVQQCALLYNFFHFIDSVIDDICIFNSFIFLVSG